MCTASSSRKFAAMGNRFRWTRRKKNESAQEKGRAPTGARPSFFLWLLSTPLDPGVVTIQALLGSDSLPGAREAWNLGRRNTPLVLARGVRMEIVGWGKRLFPRLPQSAFSAAV